MKIEYIYMLIESVGDQFSYWTPAHKTRKSAVITKNLIKKNKYFKKYKITIEKIVLIN